MNIELIGEVDIQAHKTLVESRLAHFLKQYQFGDTMPLLKFFNAYTSWNGYFANGVCSLTSLIGVSRGLFLDHTAPTLTLADRSNYVASFIFDAARDEYDDRATEIRDPHRSLAQAFLRKLIELHVIDIRFVAERFKESHSQLALNQAVLDGYTGRSGHLSSLGTEGDVFFGIGYHIGSEILADAEFTMIDSFFKKELPVVHEKLSTSSIRMCGVEHNCYDWIEIHSGDGNAVELDHYAAAITAAHKALEFSPPEKYNNLKTHLKAGFDEFALQHEAFFQQRF